MLLRGILLDLDDTLYPQAEFLRQAWHQVSEVGERLGLDPDELFDALSWAGECGSDRGDLIDVAVEGLGAAPRIVPELVSAFMAFRPSKLSPYPGVSCRLARLAQQLPIVVVTDGNPAQQRAKLIATGLASVISGTVCTDDLGGREFRKPDPAGFELALSMLGCRAEYAVMVGDRPDKDVVGAGAVGLKTILVRQGEYRSSPISVAPWRCVSSVVEALDFLLTQDLDGVMS